MRISQRLRRYLSNLNLGPPKMHTDRNNYGPSYILACGDYSCGELFIGDKREPRIGNIRDRWFRFDGRHPHATAPYVGERFSIVVYTILPTIRTPFHSRAILHLRDVGSDCRISSTTALGPGGHSLL